MITSTNRKEIYTFTESVDHSIAFVKNLSQVLQAGRQKCRPFEVVIKVFGNQTNSGRRDDI